MSVSQLLDSCSPSPHPVSRGRPSGPALPNRATGSWPAWPAAGVNADWSFGEIMCRGSGIPAISAFEIFLHNNLSEAPFLTVPVTDPFGPTWNFPLTSIPAAAGHAFDTGQIHVNWLDLTGQSAGSVRLSTAGFARVSSEIKASDGSSDAEFDFIFDDGFEAGDTSVWCVDVKVPNDGRSVGDVKVMLGDEEFTLVNNAFVNSILDPTRRSAFECFTGASATAFNPRDPSVTFSTEMTLGGEVLTGTGGPCIAIEFIDDLPGTEMSTTLCLSDDRFKAEVTWEDPRGRQAPGECQEDHR